MPLPPTAVPTRNYFDPYNSATTGHQTCPSRLARTPSWRASRSLKLSHQLLAGATGGGGKRVYDTVGAGSKDFGVDGRKDNGGFDSSVVGVRNMMGVKGMGDVGRMLGVRVGKRVMDGDGKVEKTKTKDQGGEIVEGPRLAKRRKTFEDAVPKVEEEAICALATQSATSDAPSSPPSKRGIFSSLTIYINGSTAPLISDHRLKYLLVEHGANISIGLGRRTVTHVILGRGNGCGGKGAGGGLAGGKIEKEIRRVGGKGVKYVGVEWVLESVKAGKRLGEAGFSNLSTAPAGVRSVYGMCKGERKDGDKGVDGKGQRMEKITG